MCPLWVASSPLPKLRTLVNIRHQAKGRRVERTFAHTSRLNFSVLEFSVDGASAPGDHCPLSIAPPLPFPTPVSPPIIPLVVLGGEGGGGGGGEEGVCEITCGLLGKVAMFVRTERLCFRDIVNSDHCLSTCPRWLPNQMLLS